MRLPVTELSIEEKEKQKLRLEYISQVERERYIKECDDKAIEFAKKSGINGFDVNNSNQRAEILSRIIDVRYRELDFNDYPFKAGVPLNKAEIGFYVTNPIWVNLFEWKQLLEQKIDYAEHSKKGDVGLLGMVFYPVSKEDITKADGVIKDCRLLIKFLDLIYGEKI